MVTLTLELADNGVIKILHDDNVNGAGEEYESRVVYDFDSPTATINKIKFINDIALDLGIDLGTDMDREKIEIRRSMGKSYSPTSEIAQEQISQLGREIQRLEKFLKKK